MSETIALFLLYFTSFFTLINPLGVMPVFMTMTANLSAPQRRKTAGKAVVIAGFTLLMFAFTGQFLFRFFGISIDSLRVVGGIIFFSMGNDMLQARLTRVKIDAQEIKQYVDDISVTPLAIPMITGPGAITNAIVLMRDADTNSKIVAVVGSIVLVSALTYLILLGAGRIIRFLGEVGNKVMMRLMGLIVMVIAVEFFLAGITPFILRFVH